MNAIDSAIDQSLRHRGAQPPRVSQSLSGKSLSIGDGFEAQSFRAVELEVAMDPLVMVDHYVMTAPTFGVHPHAGLSAVSLLFEDSEGRFHNRDTLGNDFDLEPGDLYWLKAGSGALHDEAPRRESRIHGLQVFVNLPQRQRYDAPTSRLVKACEMPVIAGERHRVRVALGRSNGVHGVNAPDSSMTILDGRVWAHGQFAHRLESHRNAWIHAIAGELAVSVGGAVRILAEGDALNISNAAQGMPVGLWLENRDGRSSHFALFDAKPIGESFVQQGPFVMASIEEIAEAREAHAAGRFGRID